MHVLSFLVLLGICSSSWAAPVEQKPLAGTREHRGKLYTPEHRDPYDRKVDATGKKLHPLPYVHIHLPKIKQGAPG